MTWECGGVWDSHPCFRLVGLGSFVLQGFLESLLLDFLGRLTESYVIPFAAGGLSLLSRVGLDVFICLDIVFTIRVHLMLVSLINEQPKLKCSIIQD